MVEAWNRHIVNESRFSQQKSSIVKWNKKANVLLDKRYMQNSVTYLDPKHMYMTGLRCDVGEQASVMPLIFKLVIHGHMRLSRLEKKLGVQFKNRELLRHAVMHASFSDLNIQSFRTLEERTANNRMGYISKSKALVNMSTTDRIDHSYERLEYLGDAVLGFVVKGWAFFRVRMSTFVV